MNILTLTLNPAFDVHCTVDRLTLGREHLCTITDREAGGKGVNISRALTKNGVDNLALVVLGEENADDFCRRLVKYWTLVPEPADTVLRWQTKDMM